MKIQKILFIGIILLIISMIYTFCYSYATIDPDKYKPKEISKSDYESAMPLAQKIIGSITTIGIIVSIVGTMGIGIKYMTGSVEEKAEYKKTMWPMLIGMIMLFGTSAIISIIYNIVPKE